MSENERPVLTYGELVWRDFRRNRLAMLGALVVLAVGVVAAFCPLIANDRPLYLKAVLYSDYDNALAVAMEQSAIAAERGEGVAEAKTLALQNLSAASEHLGSSDQALVQEIAQKVEAGEDVFDDLDALFDAELLPVERYPAIRGLRSFEIFVMLAVLLLALGIALRHGRGFWTVFALSLALAGVLTTAWKTAYPTIEDNRNYRRIIQAEDFRESGGKAYQTLIPFGENQNIIANSRQAPSWLLPAAERPPLREWHWLGTDTNGRDVLARMVYGSRVSMLVGIVSVAIYTSIGVFLGALAGFYGRWVDIALSRLIEVVICFPPLMVILAVQSFLEPSLVNLILALALLWWTGVARLQRAEFLRLVNLDYVQSVRALGGSNFRIIFLHILPNALGPILVLVSFGIAGSIVIESALSFLGFGVPQPMASWGDLLNNGRNDIQGLWWLTVFPGVAIFATVTCFNLMGEGVRDALDPKKQR